MKKASPGGKMYYNTKLKNFARHHRSNMTEAEKRLWFKIRRKQLKGRQFYRQRIIGNYIVDFYCPKEKLVIELDGGQHYTQEGMQKDRIRDHYLEKQGLRVIRFSDRDLFENMEGVLEEIFRNMQGCNPP